MSKVTLHRIYVLTLLLTITLAAQGDVAAFEPQPTAQFVPTSTVEYHPIQSVTGRDVVAASPPFHQCAQCRCCDANKTNCSTVQCCYRIKCNLPNKPFGTCAFVPEACNCNSCS